ncbi:MAG: exonuclease domain-containing protein [Chthoniobacterales bacterium]
MMHPLLKNASLTAIDFESAGERRGETAVPVQIGIAWMNDLQVEPASFYRSYLQTKRPITWSAQQLHGISNYDLRDAPSFSSLWPQLQQRLRGRYLVAHGRGTEKKFLRTFPLHGFGPWIDTLSLSRAMMPGLSSYKLADLIFHFGLFENLVALLPDFRWHEALSDAVASLVLLSHLIQENNLGDQPISFFIS